MAATPLAYALYCHKCDEFTPGYGYDNRVYCPVCQVDMGGVAYADMPFGKYKGRSVRSLTSAAEQRYLDWFVRNIEQMSEPLRRAILYQMGHVPRHLTPPMPWWAVLLELRFPFAPAEVKQAYRQLSKRFHPDAGGNVDQMQLLNDARQQANAYFDF